MISKTQTNYDNNLQSRDSQAQLGRVIIGEVEARLFERDGLIVKPSLTERVFVSLESTSYCMAPLDNL